MSWPVQAAVRAAMPDGMLAGAALAAADALLEAWPATDTEDGLSRGLRSCADSLRGAAGRALWTDGCHLVLLRAGRSLDTARLTGRRSPTGRISPPPPAVPRPGPSRDP